MAELRNYLCIFSLFLLPTGGFAQSSENCYQNLVPNPSFEEYETCPNKSIDVENYIPWKNPSNGYRGLYGSHIGSPDAFNVCSSNNSTITGNSVPANFSGYQEAASGNSYIGLAIYLEENFREYIQVRLYKPLEANKEYVVSFKVSLADNSIYSSDAIGALLSVEPVVQDGSAPLELVPQISNPEGEFIENKIVWSEISGTYFASGGEEYITLGNFKSDANTALKQVPSNINKNSSYYYLDDVSVVEVPPVFDVSESPQIICPGESAQLSASVAGAVAYHWSPTEGIDDPSSPSPLASPETTMLYTVTASLSDGCQLSRQVEVLVDEFTFAAGPSIHQGYTPLEISFYNESIGTDRFRWHFPDGSVIEESTPSYTFLLAGKHSIQLEAITPNGCTYWQSYSIEAKDFFIPNVITPNGDGKNDFFSLDFFEAWDLHIYNRWGKSIYYSLNYQNDFSGEGVPAGVYFYLLRNPLNGQQAKGTLTILR